LHGGGGKERGCGGKVAPEKEDAGRGWKQKGGAKYPGGHRTQGKRHPLEGRGELAVAVNRGMERFGGEARRMSSLKRGVTKRSAQRVHQQGPSLGKRGTPASLGTRRTLSRKKGKTNSQKGRVLSANRAKSFFGEKCS